MTEETSLPPTTHRPSGRVTSGPLLDLHDQLVAAAARQTVMAPEPGRQREPSSVSNDREGRPAVVTWLAAAAAVLLVVGVAIGASFAADGDVGADVNVQRTGDAVTVSIDDDVTPDQIRDALEAAGVNVRVTPQATGPSLVNRFVGIAGPASATLTGGDGTSAPAASFPADSEVELLLGVAAAPGEAYDAPPDATATGEPLAGLDIVGRTVRAARPAIDGAVDDRIEVEYRTSDGQITDDPDPTAVIDFTSSLSSTRVIVVTTETPRR